MKNQNTQHKTKIKSKKMPKENLTWLDPKTGSSFHAGVAFFDEEYGEYRLVLDAPRTVYNLVPVEALDQTIKYKVHYPIHTNGRFSHKVEVGHGYSNPNTNHSVHITIGRYASMRLVLSKSERKAANA